MKLMLRNISGEELRLAVPDGLPVKPGDVIPVDGELTEELEDAHVITDGENVRAWPKATWELIREAAKPAAKKGSE
ncbi:hypothetical protein [Nonomuraea dietziae]|uniref:hypothetical protein n=1 Tax=Nonomuraea dietziae TaxID=65515 RepID=UPI00343D1B41